MKIKQVLPKNKIDKDALWVIKKLIKAKFDTYLVGGCVRDLLLGLEPKDFDIATSAHPEEINKVFKHCRLVGRRFRLAHILFGNRKFIEVATFRSGKTTNNAQGQIVRDNLYGTIEEDVIRRDLTINALYYDVEKEQVLDFVKGFKDIENKKIKMIGDTEARIHEDPVRMIRMIRFKQKLGFSLFKKDEKVITKNAHLLGNIPPARLLEETLKLFHNEYARKVFADLENIGLLKFLFEKVKANDFIEVALTNTENRVKQNKPLTPSFLFAVFLYQEFLEQLIKTSQKQKSKFLAHQEAVEKVMKRQVTQIMIPRWVSAQVSEIWLMQYQLEQKNPNRVEKMLQKKGFRAAFDFLLLRSQSIHQDVQKAAVFWEEYQKMPISK
jgi:poly(A) polymerase